MYHGRQADYFRFARTLSRYPPIYAMDMYPPTSFSLFSCTVTGCAESLLYRASATATSTSQLPLLQLQHQFRHPLLHQFRRPAQQKKNALGGVTHMLLVPLLLLLLLLILLLLQRHPLLKRL